MALRSRDKFLECKAHFLSSRGTHHEFHVACARRLSTGRGYLFAEISSRNDFLSQSDSVVLEIDDFEFVANDRIVVDDISDAADQFYYLLGQQITGSRFSTDHYGPRDERCRWILLYSVVQSDDVHAVEQLTFVFVNTLDLLGEKKQEKQL